MGKMCECWIKPPDGEWYNYSKDFLGYLLHREDGMNTNPAYIPRHYCQEQGIAISDFFRLGYKMQWRPQKDNNWRERELKRLSRKNRKDMYDLLPREWNNLIPITDHFTHLSTDRDETSPDMLAYTISEAKGEEDVQTKIKAGKYLKRYYPLLSGDEIRYYSEAVQSLLNAVTITDDPEEAAIIYQNGPNSCMKKDLDYFYPEELNEKGIYHPVAAYFAGNLKLAYLGPKGNPTARAIVWPEKKLYGRIYGAIDRMTHALTRMGYKDDYSHGEGAFRSAKMKLISIDNKRVVWPYTDGMAGKYMKKEDKEHVYIGPLAYLDKSVRWYEVKSIISSESGWSSYDDPFVFYCAISGKIITEDMLDNKEIVGYINESSPAFLSQLTSHGYSVLDGEEYWLPKHQIVWFVDENNEYKRVNRNTLSIDRRWAHLGTKDRQDVYCHREDAVALQDGSYVHKAEAQNIVDYEGMKFSNLKSLYRRFPQLDPGRAMFNVPLNKMQDRDVRSYLYRHGTHRIVEADILGHDFRVAHYTREELNP